MFDLKREFEEQQNNNNNVVNFEPMDNVDIFLSTCTALDYERDLLPNIKKLDMLQNVDISLAKFKMEIKDEAVNYESALKELNDDLTGTGFSLGDLGLGENINHESSILTVESADSWYMRLWEWIKQKIKGLYDWFMGFFDSEDSKLQQAIDALNKIPKPGKTLNDNAKFYWKNIKGIPGAILFIYGINNYVEEMTIYFTYSINNIMDINKIYREIGKLKQADLDSDKLKKELDKLTALVKKNDIKTFPFNSVYNMESSSKSNNYLLIPTSFKDAFSITAQTLKLDGEGLVSVNVVEYSSSSKPDDYNVIFSDKYDSVYKIADKIKKEIMNIRSERKVFTKGLERDGSLLDKNSKIANSENKEALKLYSNIMKNGVNTLKFELKCHISRVNFILLSCRVYLLYIKEFNNTTKDSLSTDDVRYKNDKMIIEDAIAEKDYETLESMSKDRRVKEFPDLVEMIKKALKNKDTKIKKLLSDEDRYDTDKEIITKAIKEKDYDTLKDIINSSTKDFPDLIKLAKDALENKK